MSYFQNIFGQILHYWSIHQNSIILVKPHLVVLQCNLFYQKIVSVENKNESVKSLNRGQAKYFQCKFEVKERSYKDSNKNWKLIITRTDVGINFSILNKTFTFSSNAVKNVWLFMKFYFCIMFSWKGSAFDEVTYWFIKLIYHFKTANFPLIECQIYAVINNRLTRPFS